MKLRKYAISKELKHFKNSVPLGFKHLQVVDKTENS